ncbi:MAG: serine peptidase [Pseudonocardiaceae bacterium]
MSAHVVGVHGIGNRQRGTTPSEAAAVLGNRWSSALRRGLGQDCGLQAAVAYYAHHLAKDTAQGAGDPEHLAEPEQEMLLRWAAALGAPPEVAQGRLAAPARAAADWIARKVGLDSKLVRLLVTTFCREVHLYLTDPDRRHAARGEVADTIAAHQPAAVIAHSLGSVVAHETLWAHPDMQIDLLITLGSPLALPDVVFPRLDPAPTNGKSRRPPGVRRWINIADPGDFIAIPRGLTPYFDGIDADLTTPIGVFDTHKVTGYLACPITAAALATLLGRCD